MLRGIEAFAGEADLHAVQLLADIRARVGHHVDGKDGNLETVRFKRIGADMVEEIWMIGAGVLLIDVF